MHKSDYDDFLEELAEIAKESESAVIVVVSVGKEKVQTLAKTYGNPSLYSAMVAFDVCADVRNTILNSRKKDVLQ